MTRGARAAVAAWALLSLAGWGFASVALTVIAPLPLLIIPFLLVRTRSADTAGTDPLEPIWPLTAIFGFTYLLVPVLGALEPASFTSLPGYLDLPPAQRQFACWVAGAGYLALLAGYFGRLGDRTAALLPFSSRNASPARVGVLAGVLFAFGCASVLAAVIINDGFRLPVTDLLTGQLRSETVASFTGRGYLTVGFAALSLSVPCWVMWTSGRAWGPWLLVGVLTAVAFVLLFGVVGSRIGALGALIGGFVVIHYRVRRLRVGTVITAGLLVIAAATAVQLARGTTITGPISILGPLSLTLDGYGFLVDALGGNEEFLLGRSIVEDAVLTFLPRELWPDKPLVYGYVRAQELVVPGLYADFNQAATFPVGLLAEGYVNFGVPGALLFPYVSALVIRAVYVRQAAGDHAYYVLLMAWLVPNYLSLMRGLGFILPSAIVAALLLVPLLLITRRRRE